jgi:hypothetical protein
LTLKLVIAVTAATGAKAQSPDCSQDFQGLKLDRVKISKAELVPAGFMVPPPYPGAPSICPLPAHCRVDGIINRRKGADGQEFGSGFAIH